MSNPFLEEPAIVSPSVQRTHAAYDNAYDDDDDEDAAYDDDDDGVAVTGSAHWSSSGFASPEWWSRH